MSTPEQLPPLSAGYQDEFGPINPEVYQAARKIWPRAISFGEFALHDRSLASNLLMKAAANVSKAIATGTYIKYLNSYLLTTFKRLVVREREETLPRSYPLSEAPEVVEDVVADLDRKILAREIFAQLDNRERTTVQLWMMSYTDEQIAQLLDLNPATVRQRISRLIMRLRKTFADTEIP